MSIDDSIFGRIAVLSNYVRPDQLDECLKVQRQESPPRHLGRILLDRGYLNEEQLRIILEIRRNKARRNLRKNEDLRQTDTSFGKLARDAGYITLDDLEEAILEQQRLQHINLHFRLGEILVAKTKMKVGQVLEILARQGKRILICPLCDVHYNVPKFEAERAYQCAKCQVRLLEPKFLDTVAADAVLEG
jgi:hypothetical protein